MVSGCKGLKFVSSTSVCLSLYRSVFPFLLAISKVRVGEMAGKGPEDPEVITLWIKPVST